MKLSKLNAAALAATLSLGLFACVKPAAADTFSIQYFEVPTGTPDFHNGDANIGGSYNYVLPTLGPDGLPVYNSSFSTTFGLVNAPNSIYRNGSNELLYWTPTATNNVKSDGTGTITVPAGPTNYVNMFAPGASGVDSSYELTALLSGNFTVTSSESIAFTVGADDDAYVFVFPTGDPTAPNSLVASIGGIHGLTEGIGSSETYAPGNYTVEIFYADRDISNAELNYSDTANLNITPTGSAAPEPSTFLLLGTGLLGAVMISRRRFAR